MQGGEETNGVRRVRRLGECGGRGVKKGVVEGEGKSNGVWRVRSGTLVEEGEAR